MTAGPVPSDQEYPADRNTRPAWVDQIPIPDPNEDYDTPIDRGPVAMLGFNPWEDPPDYGVAGDGEAVERDADPGL